MSGRFTGFLARPRVDVIRERGGHLSVMLVLKNLAFLVLVPGVIAGVIPLMILAPGFFPVEGVRSTGFIPLAAGVSIVLWCMRDFWKTGHGTPAPPDPPKVLVVRGMYRFVRNPMYLGVLSVVAGEAILCASLAIAIYGIVLFVLFNLFIRFYEEPALQRKFGEAYSAYRRGVRRWIPKLPDDTPSSS